ncbi:PEP-CTERM sorting domain-containing protein [Verrucomicrobiaceae bacterium 227]
MNDQHSKLHQSTTQATKAMNTLNRHLLTSSLTLAALTGAARAGTINWGGAFFTTNYSADGTALESGPTAESGTGEVMYELGIFQNADGSEFTPTFDNASEWNERWVPFTANDSTTTSATSAYSTELGIGGGPENYFGNIAAVGSSPEQISTVSSAAAGGTLVHGYQAYIWGYDSKDISGTKQPEWFLVTGSDSGASGPTSKNWVLPDSTASNNATFDIQWDIASASVAIVGQIDDNKGGGEMVDPGNAFDVSDHQFATVPEPGSVMLSLLAGLALLRRKR